MEKWGENGIHFLFWVVKRLIRSAPSVCLGGRGPLFQKVIRFFHFSTRFPHVFPKFSTFFPLFHKLSTLYPQIIHFSPSFPQVINKLSTSFPLFPMFSTFPHIPLIPVSHIVFRTGADSPPYYSHLSIIVQSHARNDYSHSRIYTLLFSIENNSLPGRTF